MTYIPVRISDRDFGVEFEAYTSQDEEFVLYTDEVWSYVVGYCHVDVGQMTYLAFETLADLYDWLEQRGVSF